MTQVSSLRKEFIEKRQQLNSVECTKFSDIITQKSLQLNAFQHAKKIAFYASINHEVDCKKLIEHALELKKHCYLPVLHPTKVNELCFVRYTKDTELHRNRFGILEPKIKQQDMIKPEILELVFTPLVIFDEKCNRVGMGSGFYDRTFQFKKETDQNTKPILIGLAYELQKIKKLKPENWDVTLDHIITEIQTY